MTGLDFFSTILRDGSCDPSFSASFLDDGYVFATHEKIVEFFSFLRSRNMSSSGLHLKLYKCGVWWLTEPTDVAKNNIPKNCSSFTQAVPLFLMRL